MARDIAIVRNSRRSHPPSLPPQHLRSPPSQPPQHLRFPPSPPPQHLRSPPSPPPQHLRSPPSPPPQHLRPLIFCWLPLLHPPRYCHLVRRRGEDRRSKTNAL
ncbi:unnamed protein product [Pleuronectes platessa]|uniref:Uncharacterized protein n=1 Tax=Pleuronectes platessa TaxID=8262 RepID=A0A9N7TQP2_PLEPL|nr:unnamed protein product [Pleuronectes platessa]